MKSTTPPIEIFLANLEKQFEGMLAGTLRPETEFKQMAEWSSIQSLIVLASFNWDYEKNLPAEELRKAKTLQEIYESLFEIHS